MAAGPIVKLLADYRKEGAGRVWAVGPGVELWESLSTKQQEKLLQRAKMVEIASAAGRPQDDQRVRWLKGAKAKGSAELKVKNPLTRGIGFKWNNDWYLSYVGTKPRDRDVEPLGEEAVGIRDALVKAQEDAKEAQADSEAQGNTER